MDKIDCRVTNKDFNECIGSYLNSDNNNFALYVQGIKLFKEYLSEKYMKTEKSDDSAKKDQE